MNDHHIINSPSQARNCFKNTARWKSARAMVLSDHSKPCHLCHELIRFDLKAPHPLSPSVDHLPGYQVEEMVGRVVWEARRILTDISGLKPAHYGCNAAAGNENRRAVYPFARKMVEPGPEPEPLTPRLFVNQKTGERETFSVNGRTILSPDWVAA